MKLSTRLRMLVMTYLISDTRRSLSHLRGRLGRRGRPKVHYFHQVDDPYSHLAVQKLDALRDRYAVDFVCHLASAPSPEEQGDSERFKPRAIRDARSVAAFYNTELPRDADRISPEAVACAESYLSGLLQSPDFAGEAVALGNRLWRGEQPDGPAASGGAANEGSALRTRLGHWLSATFCFEGEWYWGPDRLLHLENRLRRMGLSKDDGSICVPRPEPEPLNGKRAGHITLEFFPSLRSPYTAISYDRAIDLAQRTGVQLQLRPVMPMMMRGVPATRAKQRYIMMDAKREADYYGQPFGPIVDPFGEPVRRAFSLFPCMVREGRGVEYCGNYLRAAWTQGVDITTDEGLREVVERTGVNWQNARAHLGNDEWQPLLERNVSDMLAAGLWGVPSFRVTGGEDATPFSCWGQDRLWRVETEITRRAR